MSHASCVFPLYPRHTVYALYVPGLLYMPFMSQASFSLLFIAHMRISKIRLMKYAQCQRIGKPTNITVCRSMKFKGHKQDAWDIKKGHTQDA
jgi:hypothetical protein